MASDSYAVDHILDFVMGQTRNSNSRVGFDRALENLKAMKSRVAGEKPKGETLGKIEEMIFKLVTDHHEAEGHVTLDDLLNVSKNGSKNNSLSLQVCGLIREDRGFSLVNSQASGEVPSPVGESQTFKDILDFRNESQESAIKSGKIKKIEFSDDQQK